MNEVLEMKKPNSPFRYWDWILSGSGGKPGYTRVVNEYLFLQIPIGYTLAQLLSPSMSSMANTVLLPLLGIIICLSFAWAGNAQTLMQTDEVQRLATHNPGGFVEYVYTFQTAIFSIIVTVVFWALAGLSLFDLTWPTPDRVGWYLLVKTILFTLCAISIRESWHVVLGSQLMLISQYENKVNKNVSENNADAPNA